MAKDQDKILKILATAADQAAREEELGAIIPLLKVLIEDISDHKKTLLIDYRKLLAEVERVAKMPGPRGPRGPQGPEGPAGLDADPDEVAAHIKADKRFMKALKPKDPVPGAKGDIPSHEWDGTKLRFQNADGSWGPWVELRGPRGMGGFFGGGMSGVERVRYGGEVSEGVAEIEFAGSGVSSVVRTPNGIRVTITGGGGGGGGGGISTAMERLTGSQSGTSVTLNLTALANEFITITGIFRQGQLLTPISDYSTSGGTATVFNADASEVFLVSYTYASSGIEMTTIEQISGSQSGTSVQLNTNSLAHTYISILGVFRQGQLLDPSNDWSQVSNIITVPNADAGEVFQIQYTY